MSTDFAAYCLKVVSKFLKKDILYQDFFSAVNSALQELESAINELKGNFFFDTMTEEAVIFMETLLKISPKNTQSLNYRRNAVRTKWQSSGHNRLGLIQNVCNAWKNNEIIVSFWLGKIQLKFIGDYGKPDGLDDLLKAINTVKPAHLGYTLLYRYLLLRDIHKIKTINQMNNLTIKQFDRGYE